MRKQFGYLLATALVASAVMVGVASPAVGAGALVARTDASVSGAATSTTATALQSAAGYTPVEPARIADTRGSSPVGAGGTLDVSVVGVGGVPLSGCLLYTSPSPRD